MRHALSLAPFFVPVALAAFACGSPQAQPTTPTASSSASATQAASGAMLAPTDASIAAFGMGDAGLSAVVDAATVVPSWRASIAFTNITGRTGDQTAALFTPSVPSIEGCRGATGGKLILRLRADHGRIVGDPQTGSSVDPTARQCVLDALSAVHVDDASNVGPNAPVKPMGFTSLLTIEW